MDIKITLTQRASRSDNKRQQTKLFTDLKHTLSPELQKNSNQAIAKFTE
jgi:hypothetical protein